MNETKSKTLKVSPIHHFQEFWQKFSPSTFQNTDWKKDEIGKIATIRGTIQKFAACAQISQFAIANFTICDCYKKFVQPYLLSFYYTIHTQVKSFTVTVKDCMSEPLHFIKVNFSAW